MFFDKKKLAFIFCVIIYNHVSILDSKINSATKTKIKKRKENNSIYYHDRVNKNINSKINIF